MGVRNISLLLILIVNLTSAAAERADYLGRWDLTVRDDFCATTHSNPVRRHH
jgi:hypothetical protein